jgi:hypothetical protein
MWRRVLSEYLPTFRRIVVPSTSGSSSPRTIIFRLRNIEDRGTTVFRNIRIYLSDNTASHSRRSESSATPLFGPQISHSAVYTVHILRHSLLRYVRLHSWMWKFVSVFNLGAQHAYIWQGGSIAAWIFRQIWVRSEKHVLTSSCLSACINAVPTDRFS